MTQVDFKNESSSQANIDAPFEISYIRYKFEMSYKYN